MALALLSAKGIVQLDEERKAAMGLQPALGPLR
jgi:hypothetical protein